MRTVILLIMGTLLSLSPAALAQAESRGAKVNALYQQGVLAMRQGQVDTARRCFEAILQIHPGHPQAQFQLGQLKTNGNRLAAKRRELMMQKVIVPKVEFDQLTLPEALEAINAVVLKQTEGQFSPNFVVEDPTGVFEERRFTLQLGSVPAAVALKYSLDSVRATARYDEHAIVIKPLGVRKPAPAEGNDPSLKRPASREPGDSFAR